MRTRFAQAVVTVVALPCATLIAQSWPANMLKNGDFNSRQFTPWIVTRGSPRIELGPVNGTEASGASWCVRGCVTPGNPVELVQDRIRLGFRREYAIYFDLLGRVPIGAKVECQVVTIPQAKLELWTPAQIVTSVEPMRRGTIRFKVVGNPSQGNIYKVGLRISSTARSAFRLDNVRLFASTYPLIWMHPTVGGRTSKLVVRADPGAWVVQWLSRSLWPPTKVPPFLGFWELNPAYAFPFWIGSPNRFGTHSALIPVPRDRNVTGFPLYWQGLQVDPRRGLYEFGPTTDLGMAYDWPVIVVQQSRWTKISPPARPPLLSDRVMVHDERRGVDVLYAGELTQSRGRHFEFDGKTWKQVGVGSPGHRNRAALVYEAKRRRVLLFGGQGLSRFLNETWVYDGTRWAQLQPKTSPPGRAEASLAYDSQRDRVVLFGGVDARGPLGDTWEWDGANWQRVAATGPKPRYGAAMCYDPVQHKVVLFGGQAPGTNPLQPIDYADTWVYDGTRWTKVATTRNPAGRKARNQMVHAPGIGCLLFGGVSGIWPLQFRNYNDLWYFSGTDWLQIQTPGSMPAARFGAGFTYNRKLGKVVLFGGFTGWLPANDTWFLEPDC